MNNIWYIDPAWVVKHTLLNADSYSVNELYKRYNTFMKALYAIGGVNGENFENTLINAIAFTRKEKNEKGVIEDNIRIISELDVLSLDTCTKVERLAGNSTYWKQGDHKYLSYGFYHVALFSPSFDDFKTLVVISKMNTTENVSEEDAAKNDDLEYLEMD